MEALSEREYETPFAREGREKHDRVKAIFDWWSGKTGKRAFIWDVLRLVKASMAVPSDEVIRMLDRIYGEQEVVWSIRFFQVPLQRAISEFFKQAPEGPARVGGFASAADVLRKLG